MKAFSVKTDIAQNGSYIHPAVTLTLDEYTVKDTPWLLPDLGEAIRYLQTARRAVPNLKPYIVEINFEEKTV